MTLQRPRVLVALLLAFAFSPASAWAVDFYPLFTNAAEPDQSGLEFGRPDLFVNGAYGADTAGPFEVYTQNFSNAGGSGAGISVPISNGENGSNDGGTDIDNEADPNPAFGPSGVNNPGGRLANGNVLRYSLWMRSDPSAPITLAPQIEPVVKFEFWKEAFSLDQDTNAGFFPAFGDKVFDNDTHGVNLTPTPEWRAQWVDIDGGGTVIDGDAAGDGRVTALTEEWQLFEVNYLVDDTKWAGIGGGGDFGTVADIEEIRAVMFLGDFANSDLSCGDDCGNLLIDNVLVEVFSDVNSVPASGANNPTPPSIFGDFNGDNLTNAADYTVYRDGLANGEFDEEDFNTFSVNFGRSTLASAAVPEPTSLMLLAFATTACLTGRRI